MVVIAIIGILAAIAVPQYQTYTKKAKFSEVSGATAPFKLGVELCAVDYAVTTIAALTVVQQGLKIYPPRLPLLQGMFNRLLFHRQEWLQPLLLVSVVWRAKRSS
jgi:hypothetical protein